jgi:hypothetical protein
VPCSADESTPQFPRSFLKKSIATSRAREHAQVGRIPGLELPAGTVRSWVQIAVAIVLGAGIPFSGFTPLNHASAVLGILQRPYLVIVMPSVLLLIAAIAGMIILPRREAPVTPVLVKLGVWILLIAVCLSMLVAYSDRYSVLFAITGVIAPVGLCWALRRTDLPFGLLAGVFLFSIVLLLLRADAKFLELNGFPTPQNLFTTKFSNHPYDFHYYTLTNPDTTAAFLLLPLTFSAAWWVGVSSRPARWALGLTTLLIAATLVLVYVRVAMAVGLVVIVVAVLFMPTRAVVRALVVAAIAGGVAAAVATGKIWHYLSQAASTSSSATGTVRADSVTGGLREMLHHPFTGSGIGRYGVLTGHLPAHSALISAGAELGIAGLLGVLLFTSGILVNLRDVVRANGWRGLRPAAALSVVVYSLHTIFAGGSDFGLANEFVSIWGLSLALVFGMAQTAGTLEFARPPSLERARMQLVGLTEGPGYLGTQPALAWARTGAAKIVGAGAIVLAVGVALIAFLNSQNSSTTSSVPVPVPVRRLSSHAERQFYRRAQSAGAKPLQVRATTTLAQWDFGLTSAGWTPVAGAELKQHAGYLSVRTAPQSGLYQFQSATTTLMPGHYELILRGRLLAGGLTMGALNASANHWIKVASYWYGQSGKRTINMAVIFGLKAPTPVQFIFSNFAPQPTQSAWRLDRANLWRLL